MVIDLVANSPQIVAILKSLEEFIAANPDCTKEDVFAQILAAVGGDAETAQEAMDLLATNFREINKNPDMTFEEMKTQVLAEAQLDMPDAAELDLSGL